MEEQEKKKSDGKKEVIDEIAKNRFETIKVLGTKTKSNKTNSSIGKWFSKGIVILVVLVILFTIFSSLYVAFFPSQQSIEFSKYDVSNIVGLNLFFNFTGEVPFRLGERIDCEIWASMAGTKNQTIVPLSENLDNYTITIFITGAERLDNTYSEWDRGVISLHYFDSENSTEWPYSFSTHYGEGIIGFEFPGDRGVDIIIYNDAQAIVERIELDEIIYISDTSRMDDTLQKAALSLAAESLLLIAILEIQRIYYEKNIERGDK